MSHFPTHPWKPSVSYGCACGLRHSEHRDNIPIVSPFPDVNEMKITVTKKIAAQETLTLKLPPGSTVMDLVEKAGMFVDITLSIKNEEMIPCDEELYDGDHIILLNVASGG